MAEQNEPDSPERAEARMARRWWYGWMAWSFLVGGLVALALDGLLPGLYVLLGITICTLLLRIPALKWGDELHRRIHARIHAPLSLRRSARATTPTCSPGASTRTARSTREQDACPAAQTEPDSPERRDAGMAARWWYCRMLWSFLAGSYAVLILDVLLPRSYVLSGVMIYGFLLEISLVAWRE